MRTQGVAAAYFGFNRKTFVFLFCFVKKKYPVRQKLIQNMQQVKNVQQFLPVAHFSVHFLTVEILDFLFVEKILFSKPNKYIKFVTN